MNRRLNILVIILFTMLCLAIPALAEETEPAPFDLFLVVTRQNIEMDWWYEVPSRFGPQISTTGEVVKGEHFRIFPIFNNYGVTDENKAEISYDVVITRPDGSTYEALPDLTGFEGEIPGQFLLPALGMVVVVFEPEDSFGEYQITVTAHDLVKEQSFSAQAQITLVPFETEPDDIDPSEWFLSYPVDPVPAEALAMFLRSPAPYLDEDDQLLWSALWFYKMIFEQNEFLIPHAVAFYRDRADQEQRRDLILLFHLLDRLEELPIDAKLNSFAIEASQIRAPDPYAEIVSGEQLDMLWAEFFATARVEPVRQIVTALNLGSHAGTMDKIKAGELEESDEVYRQAMLEAVFKSALWSIMSNCRQSELLLQFAIGLYETEELNELERGYLGSILNKIIQDKQAEAGEASS